MHAANPYEHCKRQADGQVCPDLLADHIHPHGPPTVNLQDHPPFIMIDKMLALLLEDEQLGFLFLATFCAATCQPCVIQGLPHSFRIQVGRGVCRASGPLLECRGDPSASPAMHGLQGSILQCLPGDHYHARNWSATGTTKLQAPAARYLSAGRLSVFSFIYPESFWDKAPTAASRPAPGREAAQPPTATNQSQRLIFLTESVTGAAFFVTIGAAVSVLQRCPSIQATGPPSVGRR
jgi:hypothetical protein